jgi:GNAT superfamily N-acetyltransferase
MLFIFSSKIMEFKVDEASKQCTFVADIGYICPLRFTMEDLSIVAFLDCSPGVQRQVAEALLEEWGETLGIDSIEAAIALILKQWSSSDIMYVMASNKNVLGFTAVDRKNFYPCISHLYVLPKYRGNGYSTMLMAIAETYIAHMHFTQAMIWCKPELVEFYKKNGYTIDKVLETNVVVMKKMLI